MIPIRVHTVLISTQHNEDVTNDQIHKDLMEHVIKPVPSPPPPLFPFIHAQKDPFVMPVWRWCHTSIIPMCA